MELLLLLSAFLTALTGAITGVRAPETGVQRVACAPPAATGAAVAVAATKIVPAQARRDCPPPPAYRALAPIAISAAVPLYLGRLRV